MNDLRAHIRSIPNPSDRLGELKRIATHHDDPTERRDLLFGTLADPYPPVRQLAARELARALDPESAAALRALAIRDTDALPDWAPLPSIEVRRAACAALGADASEETRGVLLELATDADPDLRYQCLVSLFDTDAPDELMRPLVETRLVDADLEVCVVAAQIAADRSWHDLTHKLAKRRATTTGEVRMQFTLSLVELLPELQDGASATDKDKELVDELFRDLERGVRNEVTAAASAKALIDLAIKRGRQDYAREELGRVLNKWFLHPLLKVEAAAQLTRLNSTKGLDFLSRSFDSKRKDARGWAIEVCGRLKIEPLFGRVARVARDLDDYHNDTAILSLGNYRTPDSRQLLEELAASHTDPDLRDLARRALDAPADQVLTFMGFDIEDEAY